MSAVPLLDVFAICIECTERVPAWSATTLPIRDAEVVVTERRELALRVRGACPACGTRVLEIRVEDRSAPRVASPRRHACPTA